MANVLERVLRVGEGRTLRRLERFANAINQLEDDFKELTDEELKNETHELRERYSAGESLDDLLPEAFAAVREAAVRTLGMRPFDVQLMGGAALHLGNIAEMKTGEGKTLVATMPAYLNAIASRGVHVVTVNDYLASYQSELMGRIFRALGMTTGCIVSGQTPLERREQYAADITYGTNNEFGFDYLRDNMAWSAGDMVQRGHHFAIVDEVDSILIDEARTPLIISGPSSGEANRWFNEFAQVAKKLVAEVDYEVDEKKRTVGVLEPGIEKVEDYLGIDNLYESANTPLISFLNNAIKASALFKRDKDYVVMNGEVLIVDEHTGRILVGRRYNEGIHQAIEAKEGVAVKAENQTLATVTLQNYFRLYKKLAGMTGTAETEAAEFMSTYKLGVVAIPTNKPMVRMDKSDLVYKNEQSKFGQVVEDIAARHQSGQPVLVGTTSVEKSEYLSKLLAKRGIKHEVLNAKNHAREAAIVAQAGRLGSVTVATNMAGRGTDVMLGGNAEFLAVAEMNAKGLSPVETPEEYEAAWDGVYEAVKATVSTEAAKVVEVGGLYVLGTERHESRRIDNQLRGRSGRQGDPGESRFYLSLTDDLMRLFNSAAAESLMGRGNVPDDLAIESKVVSRAIRSAQGQVEARNAEIRKNVLKYDDVLNRQREAIYGDRRHILEGDDLQDRVARFLEDVVNEIIDDHTGEGHSDDWNLDALWRELKQVYPISITIDELFTEAGSRGRVTRQFLGEEILSDAKLAYERRTDELGEPAMRELERRVVLSVIDRRWRDHLYEMDYLKDGIGLRAMAQRDPLVEYQREGFTLFQNMMGQIREESVSFLFNLEVEVTSGGATAQLPNVAAKGLEPGAQANERLSYSAPSDSGGVEVRNQRGQLEQAATAKAQQAAAAQANQVSAAFGGGQQGQNQQAGQNQQPGQNQQSGQRGAFGQRADGPPSNQPPPQNRAQRRAQEKNKGR
ncbi:preprotein translocase subunit SecA [Cryobacterium mesophilum]|uniref:Protein translocase subunit SecA n=1 Tax=Terrimesophilobacter mesophilus TaxID=433647 RepID=A0A4R8V9K9_9MICO|nr:preprotein translocase subunit SecA [Terrimesophilobacter mesophilus]MBB5632620.1 preprotein translocase subunit SecA [Terrimesophilobacter mesophilus]TFB79433.1 preprotein translocase subunit SecA [Terrimesophilobacter mesophilus]